MDIIINERNEETKLLKATVDGVIFNKIKYSGIEHNKVSTRGSSIWNTGTSWKEAVNAVDIHWNEAETSGGTITSTGELLSWLNSMQGEIKYLKEELEKLVPTGKSETNIAFSRNEMTIEYIYSGITTPKRYITASSDSDAAIVYKTGDGGNDIISIDSNSGEIITMNIGDVAITATQAETDGYLSGSCGTNVTVVPNSNKLSFVYSSSMSLNSTQTIEIKNYYSDTMGAITTSVTPEDGYTLDSSPDGTFEFTPSNTGTFSITFNASGSHNGLYESSENTISIVVTNMLYYYYGTELPTSDSIDSIGKEFNESDFSNNVEMNITNSSSESKLSYVCFPSSKSIGLYDADSGEELEFASYSTFTYANVSYTVYKGILIPSGETLKLYGIKKS